MLGLQRFIFEKEIFLNMTINWWSGPDRYFQFIFTFFFFYILPEFLRWIFLSKSSCYIRPTGRLIEIGICWYLIQFIRNKKSLEEKKRENRKMFFTSILTIPERSSTRCLKICCIVWCGNHNITYTSYLVRTLFNSSKDLPIIKFRRMLDPANIRYIFLCHFFKYQTLI